MDIFWNYTFEHCIHPNWPSSNKAGPLAPVCTLLCIHSKIKQCSILLLAKYMNRSNTMSLLT